MTDITTSTPAHVVGEPYSSVPVYLKGSLSTTSVKPAYVLGAQNSTGSKPAYLFGSLVVSSSISAYVPSTGTKSSSIKAYLNSYVLSSISAYVEGLSMANDYITLQTSNASLTKRFHVVAQGYSDGEYEKAQQARNTLGGGIDVSMGAVYKMWNPTIRVWHTVSDSNYGTLADLEYFYKLTNPNGTPSNIVTFIDHHGVSYEVYILGSFRKSLLGTEIEGGEASWLVSLQLRRITSE